MGNEKKEKLKVDFLKLLQTEIARFTKSVSTDQGDWVVKGFIDIAKNIYTTSIDTKVISKIMELLIFPNLTKDMAKAVELTNPPYSNLKQYREFKNIK